MSHKNISVVVLGNGDSLKKALITNILGKDLSKLSKTNTQNTNTEIYENDTYEFICTPDLNTDFEDKKELFADRHPDMCLLVVEGGFSIEEVSKQIQQLQEETGKPKEDFTVVLPFSCNYPFSVNTMDQVFRKLKELADNRPADDPESDMSIPPGGRYRNNHFTEPKESLKRKHSGTKVNLVLLGLAGSGKSASGNTILGKEQFTSRISSTQVTTECQVAETQIGGTHVRVIDTPDIFDDDIESSIKNKHVTKCKQLCQSGPCVYLLVMQVSRFTDGERDILRKLEKAFGSKVQDQTVILFTRGGDLQHDNISLEDFLQHCQPDLKKIVEKCDNRCAVFQNRATDSQQVKELMQTVDRILK